MKGLVKTFCALGFVFTLSPAFAGDEIVGTWESTDGESKVEISKCGSSYCNTIVWLKTPRKDTNNEDKSLRGRSLVGAQISSNLKDAGKNKWSGSVYSPRKGKTYNGFATLSGEKLTMKGCLTGAGILCQTRKFVRAN